MRFANKSLRLGVAVVLLLLAAASFEQIFTVRVQTVNGAEQQVARLNMVFAEQTGRAVETVSIILRDVQERLLIHPGEWPSDPALFNKFLQSRIEGVHQVSAVAVADPSGHILYASKDPAQLPPPTKSLLEEALPTGANTRFTAPLRFPDQTWTAMVVRRIGNSSDSVQGWAIAYLNLNYFEDFYKAVDLTENGAILLHLRDGTVLARYPHKDEVVGTSYADLPPFKDILSHDIAGTLVMDSPIDGKRRVLSIRALKAFPLAVNVSVDEHRVLVPWRAQASVFGSVMLIAGIAIVALLALLIRRSAALEGANVKLQQQIIERERAEEALRRTQRIEAVGQLTGGVAHDFNNLLTVLLGNIDILQTTPNLSDQVHDRLAAMRKAAERGSTLTGHLLAFARRQPLQPRAVELPKLISAMQDLLGSALGRRITLETHLPAGLWSALVDPTQLEAVMLNLCLNARDAMPDGGKVTISASNSTVRPSNKDAGELVPGDYIAVTVSDTGLGMSQEVLARAFEPFFSTKDPGAGSGLGLSQVFGTARQSGGDVHIESTLGRGTSVTVFLPRAPQLAANPQVPQATTIPVATRRAATTVLVVDDDDAVRRTTADLLRGLGYEVLETSDGQSALKRLHEDSAVDVLVTDVVMPGMSGPELAQQVRAQYPAVPIVFISGYSAPDGVSTDRLEPLVRKPFRALDLKQTIDRVLSLADASATS